MLLRSLSPFVCALAAVLAAPGLARAQEEPGWEKLGERQVMFRAERDTIPVTAARGTYRRILLRVAENGVEIGDVTVRFGNGETFDAQVRQFIDVGGRTRAIDLPGEARTIREVVLTYRTRGDRRDGRAMVEVWGHQAAGGGGGGAPEDRWEKLGERQVTFRAERDTIPVTAAEGTFRRVQLRVRENGVEIGDVTVRFGNGETFPAQVRQFIDAGGQTRAIDLPGEARVIREVELTYRTRGDRREGRAMVEVWGVRVGAGGGGGGGGGGNRENEGWERLGERQVMFRAERDTIPVTSARGTFRRIQLRVEENAIEILDLRVVFGNGETHDVAVRETIQPGGRTRAIDLPAGERVIRSIELVYRTRGDRRDGRATVTAWGS